MSESQNFVYNTTALVEDNLKNVKAPPQPVSNPYPLAKENDIALSITTKLFDFSVDNAEEIASRLVDSAKMLNIYNLTANQCGLRYRVFVAGSGDDFVGFFNPTIVEYSADEILLDEIDISNPALTLKIKRPKTIYIDYQDYKGESHQVRFDGLSARLIQQCYDRLYGIDFKSKASKLVLDRALKSREKKMKRFVKNMMSHRK